jgi:DNA-binding GntR family transcriptional regulator
MIKDSLARLHSHVHLFRLRYHPRISLDAVGEHDEVVAAITARSPRAAHKAMLSHLQASRDRFVAAVTNA